MTEPPVDPALPDGPTDHDLIAHELDEQQTPHDRMAAEIKRRQADKQQDLADQADELGWTCQKILGEDVTAEGFGAGPTRIRYCTNPAEPDTFPARCKDHRQ